MASKGAGRSFLKRKVPVCFKFFQSDDKMLTILFIFDWLVLSKSILRSQLWAPCPLPPTPCPLCLEGSVQFLGHGPLARPAALGAPEEGLTAGRAVVPLAFRLGPLGAALFVPLFGNLFPPGRDGPFHDPDAGGKEKLLD